MVSQNAKRIVESLARVGKIGKFANVALKVFLVMYVVLVIPVFCFSAITVFVSGFPLDDILWTGVQLVPVACSILTIIFVCITLMQIFNDISKGESPFTIYQSKRLFIVGWLLLASFVFGAIASMAPASYAQIGPISFGLFVPTHNPSGIDLNFGYVLSAVVSYCFSYVFKYGALLQQLSDDTV